MGSSVEVPVFVDTNLGTRIAMAISPDITACDFKREVEKAHLDCFPELGEIRVNGLMVKRKTCFYHLPESLLIKHAFQSSKGTWFLHMEAYPWSASDKLGLCECLAAEVGHNTSNGSDITDSQEPENHATCTSKNHKRYKRKKTRKKIFSCPTVVLHEILRIIHLLKKKKKKKKKKRRKVKKHHFLSNEVVTAEEKFVFFASTTEGEHTEEWHASPMVDNPCETSLETVSVSGIIKKYFSDYDEVISNSDDTSRAIKNTPEEQLITRRGDNCTNIQVDATAQITAKTRPRMLPFPLSTDPSSQTSRDKLKGAEVGKRLLVASNNLSISGSKQKPVIALHRFRDGKSSEPKSSSLIRRIVFEISDNDD
ncbi:uncharacterized protein LOC132312282 isoform X2 [Cornus florida]|uniref:uncharacterized protein LOC132312282 isoform X2 n=1 Tax=Cornus florida TaxID=4283 RepID=UPI00289632A8|nr:uncharacterized protein LOC132312282 isoform X2 [Cornus florida]